MLYFEIKIMYHIHFFFNLLRKQVILILLSRHYSFWLVFSKSCDVLNSNTSGNIYFVRISMYLIKEFNKVFNIQYYGPLRCCFILRTAELLLNKIRTRDTHSFTCIVLFVSWPFSHVCVYVC